MATVVNKNFKIKQGLVVEGTTGSVGGFDILTKKQDDQDYIVSLIGGTATPTNTPDTVVKRDENGSFAAGTVTANRFNIGSVGFIEDDGAIVISNTDGDDIQLNADDIRLNSQDDIVLGANGDIRLESANIYAGTNLNYVDSEKVATRGYVDDAIGAIDLTFTTDDVTEGTNRYFTEERIDDHISGSFPIEYDAGEISLAVATGGGLVTDEGGLYIQRSVVDGWYDASGAAAAAQTAAEATASADATSKANDAEAAAILAAAGDATTKANNAQSAAEDYADSLAVNYDVFGAAAAAQTAAEGFATQAVADLVNGAPAVLDTLAELATALENNPDIIADLQDVAAGKQDTLTAGNNIDITGATISVTGLDTDDVSEGTNLYFTDFRAQEAVSDVLGTGLNYGDQGDGNVFLVDENYISTRAYAESQAGTAQENAQDYADLRASDAQTAAIEAASQDATTKANNAQSAAEDYADGLAGNYDTAGSAATAETNANSYTDTAISNLDTDDIEEGANNLYFTTSRAKTDAASLLTSATLSNITITGNGSGLTITAENGVAGSTTTDLTEGTNLYFTDTRAKDAVAGALGTGIEYQAGSFDVQIGEGLEIAGGTGNEIVINRTTVDAWYDANGAAAAAQESAEDYADGLVGTLSEAVDNLTTSDIAEGTNKYFTEERARDAVATALTSGTNIEVTSDDAADTITVSLSDDVVISGSLEVESNDFNVGSASVGLRTTDGYVNPLAVFSGDFDDDYAQVVIKNTGNGVNSSSDLQLYSNNGNDVDGGWVDLGVTSSNFSDPGFTITGANDGYIFMEAPVGTTGNGDFVIATGSNGERNAIVFAAGGLQSDNTQMTILPDESVIIAIDTPSTSPSTGALVVNGGVGIQGDVNIQGNITFGGEGSSLTTENLAVTDPLIYVGDQNAGDAVDMGIVTEYKDGATTKFAGLVRDASDGVFKVFSEATTKPTATVNFSEAGLEYGDLKVDEIVAATATLTNVTIGVVNQDEIAHLNGVTSGIQGQLDDKLELAGGTMTGSLTLAADPTSNLEAATKQYVDSEITSVNGAIDVLTTTDISEGTNLYFTDERAIEALENVVPNFTEVDINSVVTQVAATSSATASTANVVYAFAKADYRSAKFLVKVAYGTHTEVSEVLLTLDSSDNVALTEFAVVGTNGSLSVISAGVSGGNVQLTVNPGNTSTVTVFGTLLA